MSSSPASALKYAEVHRDRFLDEMKDLLTIPSISALEEYKPHVHRGARWVATRLRKAGMERVEIIETEGHPLVFAELHSKVPNASTVLVYGHYDVQSPAPLEGWESDPFKPSIRGENLYARGSTDMKGQFMATLSALESLVRTDSLSVNVKFLLEGEEEVGSPHLREFILSHRDILSCDFSFNPDAGMLGPELPTIVYGLRGLYLSNLRIIGPSQDLHSGVFGGTIHNPIHALCELIEGLHDDKGRITLNGFYEKVRPLNPQERKELAQLNRDEKYYKSQTGVNTLWGEEGFTPNERTFARPTLDVVQIQAGNPKTAIPREATARITMRLVPEQDPNEVHQQFQSYLETHTPRTVTWEILNWGGCRASLTERNTPWVEALCRALEETWRKPPLFMRGGGTIPVVSMLQEELGVDSVMTGFSLPEDNMHGPNEKLHLPTWKRGIVSLIHFFYNLGEEKEPN